MKKHEKIGYRVLFTAAAIYNAVFAAWSGLAPRPFFASLGASVPANWQWVAPIVGLFVICYAYAAWRPERADVAIVVGLASKIAGPLAWLAAVMMGLAEPALFPLLLVGDLLWWLPFVAYLLRRHRLRSVALMGWCFGVHLLANICLLLIAGGTELEDSIADRQTFVLEHTPLWVAAWFLWSLSSMSLLGFCSAWAAQIRKPRTAIAIALSVIGVGLAFDLYGEALLVTQATRDGFTVQRFATVVHRYQVACPVVANGLYCVGGFVLSVLSWQAGLLRRGAGVLGFLVWIVGFGLTAAALANHRLGMVATGGGLMMLFLPWSLIVTLATMKHCDRTQASTDFLT